ncbi:ABC transporter substrate-binding protein [Frigoribacterium sp. UYMn621]|uniref:ABC transporter substrate-binding protein n=1 Tax=Frigoribacterium sp. UYMn621 TaxID=3156343 RepID=UPI0033978603
MRKTIRKATMAVAVFGLVVSLAACSGGSTPTATPAAAKGPLKIGVPLGITGPAALVGTWARAGVEAAANELNRAGGIGGRKVELVFLDTETDPTKAVSATTRLINQDRVDFVVGPMTSDETLATLPMLRTANIASINGSSSGITPKNAPLSFAMLLNASDQAAKMVDFAVKKYHAKRIATANYSATQGKTAHESFLKTLDTFRLKPVAEAEYDIPVTDMTPQLLSLKQGNPDFLLLVGQTGSDTGQFELARRGLNMENIPAIGNYATTFAAQTMGVAGPNAYANLNSVTWSAFGACTAKNVRPQASGFIDHLKSTLSTKAAATMSYDYAAVWHDAVILLGAAYEATGGSDGAAVAKWLETKGAAEADKNKLLVHTGWAMSKKNHFLFNVDSLALVNPGKEVAPKIFQRIDCD